MAINLIPQEQKIGASDNSFIYKGIFVGFIVVAILGLILGAKYFINKTKINNLIFQEQELAKEESNYQIFKDSLDKYKSTSYFQILTKHTYFSDFFKSLENATLENVRISSLNMEKDNLVSIEGEAKGNYADISQFSKFLKAENFEEVRILNANLSGNKVSFSISFKYPESMILR